MFLIPYLAKVVTAADGTATADFDLPEYSGKGRLMIVGASRTAFASQADPVRIARDVTVEVTAPRAVAPGDTFEIPLDVFSVAGAASGTAEIKVTAEGPVTLTGDTQNKITLGEGKPKKLIVKGEAGKEAGVAAVNVAVTVPGREDLNFSRRVEMVVRPPYPRTSSVVSAMVKEGEGKDITLPGGWLKGGYSLAFSVDSTPVLGILPALEYLREYPYGCLEQTTSRAWPYLTLETVQKALAQIGNAKAIENNSKAALQGAVDRISSMQTAGGGFSMWPGGGTPRPWLSVNATHILVEAKSRIPVNSNTLDRALSYMEYLLGAPVEAFEDPSQAYTTKAYAAFVLSRAGKTPLSRLQTLSEHTDKMYPSGRLFLAGAKSLAAGNAKALEALTAKELTYARKDGWNSTLESDLRNTALELYVWSLADPRHQHTLDMALRLSEQVGKNRWFTTQEAGMASLAVGVFLEKTASGQKGFSAAVQVGDAAAQTVAERRIFGNAELPAKADGTPPAIRVNVEKGSAYCVYSVRGVPTEEPQPPATPTGLSVEREWHDGEGNAIDFSAGPLKLKQGERVVVTIQITAAAATPDVVLSDLLPGGMEVENPRLESAGKSNDGEESSDDDSDNSSTSTKVSGDAAGVHLDLREDRVLVFFDRLTGSVTYSYSMRAVSKGTFTLPPTSVEGMYNPERNDLAPSGSIVIE